MAPSALLRPLSRLLAPARLPSRSSARSKFYARDPPNAKPDWLKVVLSVGTSIFLWVYLIRKHNEYILEYKRRNELE
ncbi:NADH dehydrogenase [ubiquinone] 1 subunit C1, mitochondrial [Cebus imitator]|uniref:NADH dehydrogenase [ubiquinone] 1 subunit C1, mitochondrial n=2 Tax=Cebinae TaxID=38070 RepID=A0A2K5PS26_CEBIM|nr:NADH dehydrogenase [ubiquinone] 1 subunit C1, mitochondrial [Cebus imitator]XP_017358357.1 NADH dehydrogenase [ubiquinone] 1 subunit C1, mitochondrial [Cebus imitator]XP_032129498.1 NADH dehydrogenase [ubiquinone] 1 subunit C1, mitochondrial [Sapajus apella]XP_032129499.1 NADH dehydrogenase [ubiquinone] 1 subunit C1, mitochondrial [Sapajus apella]